MGCASALQTLTQCCQVTLLLCLRLIAMQVEQFCITSPEDNHSWDAMEEMLGNAEAFYSVRAAALTAAIAWRLVCFEAEFDGRVNWKRQCIALEAPCIPLSVPLRHSLCRKKGRDLCMPDATFVPMQQRCHSLPLRSMPLANALPDDVMLPSCCTHLRALAPVINLFCRPWVCFTKRL